MNIFDKKENTKVDFNNQLKEWIRIIRIYGDFKPDSISTIKYHINVEKYGFMFLIESNFSILICLQDSPCTYIGLNYDKINEEIQSCFANKERYSEDLEIKTFMEELSKRIHNIDKTKCLVTKLQTDFSKYLVQKFYIRKSDGVNFSYSDVIDNFKDENKQNEINELLKNLIRYHSGYCHDFNFLPYNMSYFNISKPTELVQILSKNTYFQKIAEILDTKYNLIMKLVIYDKTKISKTQMYNPKSEGKIFLYLNSKNAL